MAGMPEMQEHFPANAMDGGYAGAFSGERHGWRVCRSIFRRTPWMAGMPEMQEQFSAVPGWHEYLNRRSLFAFASSQSYFDRSS